MPRARFRGPEVEGVLAAVGEVTIANAAGDGQHHGALTAEAVKVEQRWQRAGEGEER